MISTVRLNQKLTWIRLYFIAQYDVISSLHNTAPAHRNNTHLNHRNRLKLDRPIKKKHVGQFAFGRKIGNIKGEREDKYQIVFNQGYRFVLVSKTCAYF